MMRPLSINLARRPFRNNTVYWAVFTGCFVLLTAASAWNAWDFVATGRELQRLDEDLEAGTSRYMALHDEVQAIQKETSKLNLAALNSRSTFANGLILSRFFSWSLLFDRLEDIIPADVKIRSIRPSVSPKGIEIQIDGLSRTAESLYEFEQALDESQFFSSVYPISESSRESKNEINFDLALRYIPAGEEPPEEVAALTPPSPTAGLPIPPADPNAQPPAADPNAAGQAPAAAMQETTEAAASSAPPPVPPSADAAAPPAAPPQRPPGAPSGPAPAVSLPRAVDPSDPRAAEGDPATWSDEDFRKAFGEIEFLRQRGRGKGKGKGKGKVATPPPADPNGATP